MTDMVHLREVARGMKRLWLIPLLFALIGVVVGLSLASRVPPIYRSQATILVGPTDGVVTQTATVRTSEDLASFYADLARRQIILQPVEEQLNLGETWSQLRDRVSAVVPAENLRLVTVTISGDTQSEANSIANKLVDQLVSLSPAEPGGNSQAFINQQLDRLRDTIEGTQRTIDGLKAQAAATSDPAVARQLQREVADNEERLAEWQGTYVELISAEPTSDAGGLQVLDRASPVTNMGRSGTVKLALIDGFVGAAFGLVVAWLLYRRGHDTEAESKRANVDAAATSLTAMTPKLVTRQPGDVRDLVPSRHGYGLVTHTNGRVAGTRTPSRGDVSARRLKNGVAR